VSDISEVTISKCHKKIEKHTIDLVPGAILNKYVNKQPAIEA